VTELSVIAECNLLQSMLTLPLFFTCSLWLPPDTRQTSRRYSNSPLVLFKKSIPTGAVVLKSPVIKLWQVHLHGLYVHFFFHKALRNISLLVSGPVIRMATECHRHDLSVYPERLRSGTASHPCDSGAGPILLKHHIVYFQPRNKEVQHVEVHVTSSGSIGRKEWPIKLFCLQHRTH